MPKSQPKPSTLRSRIALWIFLAIVATLVTTTYSSIYIASLAPQTSDISIGRDPSWYPINLAGQQSELVAFTNEFLRILSEESKTTMTFVHANSTDNLAGLQAGDYDALITSVLPTENYNDHYLFSDPFFLYSPVLYVKQDSPIHSLEDTAGKLIGISAQSSLVFDTKTNFNAVYLTYDQAAQALEKLSNNELDGVIVNGIVAHVYNINLYGNRFRPATPPLNDDGLRLVTPNTLKGEKLIALFNRELKVMREDGSYALLLKRWGFPTWEEETPRNLRAPPHQLDYRNR
ncbi:MAG: transporter substrate-binding domain-containing protein [Chlamydiia bacterium]|nr:transporter substrate-binding domain-containing protein [Chlamydiia bacterium]